jgi:hypothetical protein
VKNIAWNAKFPTWLLSVALTLVPLTLAALGIYYVAFHLGHSGMLLLWASGASILLIAGVVGRELGPIMLSVYGAGLFLVFVIMAGPAFLQSAVLQVRGQTVSARVVSIVTDPAYPASTDDGCRSCSHTHGYIFQKHDGSPVRGYPYGTDKTLRVGDVRPVVVDPEGQIDSRSPHEVQPLINGIFLLLATAIAYGVCQSSSLAWRKRHQGENGGS